MEKRVLLAIFLCFLSLYLWQTFVVKPIPKPAAAPAATGSPSAAPTSPAEATATVPHAAAAASAPTAAPASADVVIGETAEKTIRIETADVIAEFTNRGDVAVGSACNLFCALLDCTPICLIANDFSRNKDRPLPPIFSVFKPRFWRQKYENQDQHAQHIPLPRRA